MSGLVTVEDRESMVGELERKERVTTSSKMRRACDNLSLHRERSNKLVE